MISELIFGEDIKNFWISTQHWKEPHGRWITNEIQNDPTQSHMFMLKNDDAYVGLQALVSISNSIQPIM